MQIWRKNKYSPSPFRVTSKTVPAEPALDCRIGCAFWLVILKGLDGNSIFLQICNLHTIQFHILSCSLWLQFVRVLILFWAPSTMICTLSLRLSLRPLNKIWNLLRLSYLENFRIRSLQVCTEKSTLSNLQMLSSWHRLKMWNEYFVSYWKKAQRQQLFSFLFRNDAFYN